MPEHSFNFNGTDIFYRTYGDPAAGRLMVSVHGLTGNSTDCSPLLQALVNNGNYFAAAIDMPGRGKSGCFKRAEEYSYKIYMQVLEQFLAQLNADEYILDWYGISMGGLLGMRLAGEQPGIIDKLILNDIGPRVPQAGLDFISEYLAMNLVFDSFDEYKEALKMGREINYGPLPDMIWQEMAQNNYWVTADGKIVPAFDRKIAPLFKTEPLGEVDIWPLYEKITSDLLVLRGGKSTLFPLSVLEEMKKRYHGGGRFEVMTYPECGHVPPVLEKTQIDPVIKWLVA